MPVGWFLAPYKRRIGTRVRYCAMNDFTLTIRLDGGSWSERECLGDHAICKVNALSATLTLIGGTAGFTRVPARFTDLSQTLGDLTSGERTALRNKLIALGYTAAEIDAAVGATIGAWRTKTLRQVLGFALNRRLEPRYDAATDAILLDGPPVACGTVEAVDSEVP